MKKLIIATCAVAFATVSQAASIVWSSGTFTELPSCTNPDGVGYAEEGPACVTAYLWTFTAEEWAANSYTTSASVYDAFKAGTLTAASSHEVSEWLEGVAAFNTDTTTSGKGMEDGTQYYAAALFLHDDGEGIDYYMGNWATAEAAETVGAAGDLGALVGGGSSLFVGETPTAWTAASNAPEPTSGLLLLLGVAGLALRRRRA